MCASYTNRFFLALFCLTISIFCSLKEADGISDYCQRKSKREGRTFIHHDHIVNHAMAISHEDSHMHAGKQEGHDDTVEVKHQTHKEPDEQRYYVHGGSIRGHAIPGTMWILWGTWWFVGMLYYWMSDRVMRIPELYKSHFLKRQLQVQGAYKRCSHQTFSSQAWFEVPFFKSLTLCIAEPLLKISLPTIGIILELYLHIPGDVCYRRLILNGNFDHETINSWIHTTLYAGVILSGIIDLLVYSKYLPQDFDKLIHVLVFMNEGIIFVSHLKGSELDQFMHKIIVGITFAYVIASSLDFTIANHICMSLLRPFLLILRGSWMIQTGIVLFKEDSPGRHTWLRDMHASIMVMPTIFSLHCFVILTAMMFLLWSLGHWLFGYKWKEVNDKLIQK